jgi:prepilin-type N-terminal cleavage/methylation domain-containing protein
MARSMIFSRPQVRVSRDATDLRRGFTDLRRGFTDLRRGFTIVELLVVISVIAILLSLISVGLLRGSESSRQTTALSNLREIGRAWTMYGNQNDDRCLPGYLEEAVQQTYRIRTYDQSGDQIDPSLCTTYPNRLLPFLEFDRSLLYRYIPDYQDLADIPPNVIRDHPAFGYNAHYVGGWWEQSAPNTAPRMRFSDTGYFKSPGVLVPRQEVVARSISQIQRPSSLITFCASTRAVPGVYKNPDELPLGSATVVPHTLAQTPIWAATEGGPAAVLSEPGGGGGGGGGLVVFGNSAFEVFVEESIPIRRIQNVVQTLRADGSTALQGPRELMDQSRWINVAHQSTDPFLFTHPQ